jgi:hypothetical protein
MRITLAISLCLAACSTQTPGAPKIVEVRPSSGTNTKPVPIEIIGDGFYAVPHANYDDKDKAYSSRVFVARLGGHALESVTLASPTRLTAVVPAGLPPKTYDLELKAPDGERGTAAAVYTVLGAIDAGPDVELDLGPDMSPDTSPACRYRYRRAFTIASGKVGLDNVGTLPATGFPVVVQLARDWLKTTTADPTAGRVASAAGHDIIFRAANGTTNLAHEIEAYDGTTGSLTAWARIDSLSKATDTTFYLYYGNPCVTAATQDAAAVWDTHHKGVWHLNGEAAGTGTQAVYRDSTSNANHGDDMVSATGQLGQLAGGQDFDGVDDYIDCGAGASLNIKQKLTLSAWIRTSDRPSKGSWHMVMTTAKTKYQMFVYGTSNTTTTLGGYFELDTGNVDIWNGPIIDIAPATWTHAAITFDGKGVRFYVNGELDHTENVNGAIKDSSLERFFLGYKDDVKTKGLYWKGRMDEVRVSDTRRSDDWIRTSYNNQSDPQGFYSVGAEELVQP